MNLECELGVPTHNSPLVNGKKGNKSKCNVDVDVSK